MGNNVGLRILLSLFLILGSAFFVAAEYALVGARKSRLEAMARKGSRNAKAIVKALENVSPYVAGTQIGITLLSIAIGSFIEPFVTEALVNALKGVNHTISFALSLLIVTFVLVVVGELTPKYLTLRSPERVALVTFRPLLAIVTVLRPLVWLAHNAASLILRSFGVNIEDQEKGNIPKEELLMMIQAGGNEGTLDKMHADMITRALRLDVLSARDIMVHRLDVKWLDVTLSKEKLLTRLKAIPYSRIPVCRGDIDDMVGIVYLHDVVRNLDVADFSLEAITRPFVAIPETLSMERIVQTMREQKTQMLVVMDEYGGTSGIITLEDLIEEIFGELEDRLESERPPIESHRGGRISARADVRFDELVSRLELPIDIGENTDTLAQIIVDTLERIPRPGDTVDTQLGKMRVENMARRRITRVAIQLAPELLVQPSDD